MPAAAVIPAPIAYTKIVAVKKLVVDIYLNVLQLVFVPNGCIKRFAIAPLTLVSGCYAMLL